MFVAHLVWVVPRHAEIMEKKSQQPLRMIELALFSTVMRIAFFSLWVLSAAFGPYCTQTLKLVTSKEPSSYVYVSPGVRGQNRRLCTVVDLSAKCWMSFRPFKVAQASQLFLTSNYDVRVSTTFLTSLNLRYMLHIRTILQWHCTFSWCIAKLFFSQHICIKFKTDRVLSLQPFYTFCYPYILSW